MFLDWLFRLVLLFYTATQDSSKYYENVRFPTASLSGYYYFRDFASFRPKKNQAHLEEVQLSSSVGGLICCPS